MRSPTRLGNPTLGMAESGLPVPPSPSRMPSSDCGPSVQFAPMACTFCAARRAAASARARSVDGRAFFGKRHLRDDGQRRERADRVDGREQQIEARERLQNKKVDAALFERLRLLAVDVEDLLARNFANARPDAQRPDRAGDEHFVGGRFARLAGDFHAAVIERHHLLGQSQGGQFHTIGAEGIGLDNLRSGLDVGLVHAENRLRLGNVQLLEAALRTGGFKQHRAHGPIGHEHGILEALRKVFDSHRFRSGACRA